MVKLQSSPWPIRMLLTGLLCLGCSERPQPAAEVPVPVAQAIVGDALEGKEAGETQANVTRNEPYEAAVGGFKFTVPATWQQQPPKSEFTLGEFSIPGADGAARLTVSSAGGGVEANLERWRGQFSRGPNDLEPSESEITFDGQKGTLLELSGSYTDMFSAGKPNRNWRMLGVAVPMGPTNVFVKLTGPQTTVTDQRDPFLKFIESAKAEK